MDGNAVMWERRAVVPAWQQAPRKADCPQCRGASFQWTDESRVHKEPCDQCGYNDLIAARADRVSA